MGVGAAAPAAAARALSSHYAGDGVSPRADARVGAGTARAARGGGGGGGARDEDPGNSARWSVYSTGAGAPAGGSCVVRPVPMGDSITSVTREILLEHARAAATASSHVQSRDDAIVASALARAGGAPVPSASPARSSRVSVRPDEWAHARREASGRTGASGPSRTGLVSFPLADDPPPASGASGTETPLSPRLHVSGETSAAVKESLALTGRAGKARGADGFSGMRLDLDRPAPFMPEAFAGSSETTIVKMMARQRSECAQCKAPIKGGAFAVVAAVV